MDAVSCLDVLGLPSWYACHVVFLPPTTYSGHLLAITISTKARALVNLAGTSVFGLLSI
jgi:hypothetical protein